MFKIHHIDLHGEKSFSIKTPHSKIHPIYYSKTKNKLQYTFREYFIGVLPQIYKDKSTTIRLLEYIRIINYIAMTPYNRVSFYGNKNKQNFHH